MNFENFITLSQEERDLLACMPEEEKRCLQIAFHELIRAVLSDEDWCDTWIYDFCERWNFARHDQSVYPEIYADCACIHIKSVLKSAIENFRSGLHEKIYTDAKTHDISDIL